MKRGVILRYYSKDGYRQITIIAILNEWYENTRYVVKTEMKQIVE